MYSEPKGLLGTQVPQGTECTFHCFISRDAIIVTFVDSLTSLISGITMFGILGNLAYELDHETIDGVVGTGGVGITFISYPNAMAKFPFTQKVAKTVMYLFIFLSVSRALML